MTKVLVTGGSGFVGSHIVDALIEKGYQVRVLDNLEAQVHGENAQVPEYLHPDAEFIKGDVRDADTVYQALDGVEILLHQAAAVGVGQSMYQIAKYTSYNSFGGAVLLDVIVNRPNKVRKILVASSMSIYGEGKYKCPECGEVMPQLRSKQQLQAGKWEMLCPKCTNTCQPMPTDEDKLLYPTSIYAITKRDHEEMFLAVGRSYKIPTVALRYFNIYGPRQALSNPYTGVAAIFSSRILNGNPPVIYEDGLQSRDFIHVKDIAQANILAMEKPDADYQVLNVGTGNNISILDIARVLIKKIAPHRGIEPSITNQFREGDIRHCYADISRIRRLLGFQPTVRFEDGIEDLTEWVRSQRAVDLFDKAREELRKRGLA